MHARLNWLRAQHASDRVPTIQKACNINHNCLLICFGVVSITHDVLRVQYMQVKAAEAYRDSSALSDEAKAQARYTQGVS
jgi:hypothetical protein